LKVSSKLEFPYDIITATSLSTIAAVLSYLGLFFYFKYPYSLFFFNLIFVSTGLIVSYIIEFRRIRLLSVAYIVMVLAFVDGFLLSSAYALYGIMLAFGGFLVLPLFGALLRNRGEDVRIVLEACGILFAIKIVLFPFPVQVLDSALILPIAYTILVTGIMLYVWFRRISLDKVGLWRGTTKLSWQMLAGIASGLLLGLFQYLVLSPKANSIGPNLLQNIVYVAIFMIVFVGLTEELLFRGIIQTHMTGFLTQGQSIYVTSIIFSLFQIGWSNPFEILSAFLVSSVFGYLMMKTNSLISPVLAHGLSNVTLYLLALRF